ncbi:profilin-4-like isoform X1 [Mizuhopecten yessoensis]|uniref:profilin-4-like isoform X1 n=2 Tax=Mizuhopecten yessoensis TaxID=6573 RepID=UPI000B45C811|nr:profilin-4-like isoform X1 [Mizuhopecten yessoensis]
MSKPFNLTAHFETKGLVQRVKAFETLDAVKMNQLQNLIHDALISTNNVQHCAIVRRKDCNVRASSVGFNLYPDQVQMLLDAFKNPPQTREEGVYFDDGQYKCVRADKNSIYGKCEKKGLILVKTLSMLVVATYTESMYPSVCVEAVEKLADYFKEKGK